MTAGIQRHRKQRIARRQDRLKDRLIRLAPRMGLHIGEAAAEQPTGALDGNPLDNVHIDGTAVIAVAGQALDGLVGEEGSLHLEHGAAYDVFGSDQFDHDASASASGGAIGRRSMNEELAADEPGAGRVGRGDDAIRLDEATDARPIDDPEWIARRGRIERCRRGTVAMRAGYEVEWAVE